MAQPAVDKENKCFVCIRQEIPVAGKNVLKILGEGADGIDKLEQGMSLSGR